MRIWDAKTCEQLHAFRPPQSQKGLEVAVTSVHLNPLNTDQLVVCNRSSILYLMTMQGQVGAVWNV